MYKLLIIDDEKEVRDAISELIDWESLGVRLIGNAGNGVEGLNMILDEYPDIVMTDIRMPGLSGIDLIRKVSAINSETRFIILTGFGEFEYAKQAMEYGVKHYLLKPCDEEEIIRCIGQICDELRQKEARMAAEPGKFLRKMEGSVLRNFFRDGLNRPFSENCAALFDRYREYLDLEGEAYSLLYVYFLTEENLNSFLLCMKKKMAPDICELYVKNTLLLFGRASEADGEELARRAKQCRLPHGNVGVETKAEQYQSLRNLLGEVLKKVKRYEVVYFGQNCELSEIENQTGVQRQIEELLKALFQCEQNERAELWENFCLLVRNITDREFFCRVAASILIRTAIENGRYSVLESYGILKRLEENQDMEAMKQILFSELERVINADSHTRNGISRQIEDYVNRHLEDTSLSLKWISENVLFMNVDYVSRRFVKETGRKFSAFLAETRIQRAKELMMAGENMTLTEIAEKIGCGNNPQYFGQLFKKVEGVSPGIYMENFRKI